MSARPAATNNKRAAKTLCTKKRLFFPLSILSIFSPKFASSRQHLLLFIVADGRQRKRERSVNGVLNELSDEARWGGGVRHRHRHRHRREAGSAGGGKRERERRKSSFFNCVSASKYRRSKKRRHKRQEKAVLYALICLWVSRSVEKKR